MSSKYARLPPSSFLGKFVKLPFPYFDEKVGKHLYVIQWVKITGVWGSWLVGQMEGASHLRPDLKVNNVTHFLPEDIEDVMAAPGARR